MGRWRADDYGGHVVGGTGAFVLTNPGFVWDDEAIRVAESRYGGMTDWDPCIDNLVHDLCRQLEYWPRHYDE